MNDVPIGTTEASSPGRRLIGPLVELIVGAVMAVWSWNRWHDLIVDFGRELYVPWQIIEGRALYQDLAYFNGPLSPYSNAAFFRLFGVGFSTLVWANLLIVVVICVLIHCLVARTAGRLAAACCVISFLTLSAFSKLIGVGSFCYLTPYSHELTHGTLLALGAIAALGRFQRTRERRLVALCGLLTGLAFLTKAEIFLATSAAMVVGWTLALWSLPARERLIQQRCILFIACAALPAIIAGLLLSTQMPAATAWRGVAGSWPWVLGGKVPSIEFFREKAGYNAPFTHLGEMLLTGLAIAALLSPAVWAGLNWTAAPRARKTFAGLSGITIFCLLISPLLGSLRDPIARIRLLDTNIIWLHALQPLPMLSLYAVIAATWIGWRHRGSMENTGKWVSVGAFGAFAFVMCLKLLLQAHLFAYGFAHVIPATILFVALVVGFIPDWIRRHGGWSHAATATGIAMVAATIVIHLCMSQVWFSVHRFPIGSGPDAMLVSAKGPYVQQAIDAIEETTSSDATLAVFPEGVMINYLTRRANPTPYNNYIPPELLIFDEHPMLDSLKRNPPDLVMIVHRQTGEYGSENFGTDYAGRIYRWLQTHYEKPLVFGARPFAGGDFGVMLLRKRNVPIIR